MNVTFSKAFIKASLKLTGKHKVSLKIKIGEVKAASSLKELTECKKLVGFFNVYRIRIGDYRAFFVFTLENETAHFEYLVNRGEAYRKEYLNYLRNKGK